MLPIRYFVPTVLWEKKYITQTLALQCFVQLKANRFSVQGLRKFIHKTVSVDKLSKPGNPIPTK